MEPLRQSYLTALTAAEQKATREGKADELKAITEEKVAVTAGNALPAVAAPLFPSGLATPRANLLRETTRVDHEYTLRAQQAAGEYLRSLDFYENRARAAGQSELLQQIGEEKRKVAGQNAAVSPTAHGNLALNGNFADKNEDGTPKNWNVEGTGKGAVATEQSTTFLRMISGDTKEMAFVQAIQRPASAHELQLAVRLRCRDLKPQGICGLIIVQQDAENKRIARDLVCVLKAPSPSWKTLNGVVAIHPETKRVVIRCDLEQSPATVDFADVRVEAR